MVATMYDDIELLKPHDRKSRYEQYLKTDAWRDVAASSWSAREASAKAAARSRRARFIT
jgi:hypothetical protein